MRDTKGRYKAKNAFWLLFTTVFISGAFWSYGLYVKNTTLKADLNYQTAYSKSIEMIGLEHWNEWYALTQNRYQKPNNNEDIIRYVFGKDADLAIRVAKCESGLNEKAVNKTSSARGLFQIMQSWHKIDQKWLFDPMINTLVAYKLFTESGNSFSPHWNASINCWGDK